ncbi:putative very-long-chain acyl-CoA synthetase family protein (CefD1) [Aspergillus stella-maris]|uniref:putative very-long-chain acyl-CoA synthetase family protein (CefD1) n=1 Tax=Aspergillus stella-maris TaxID=1810926 RepID=UPI003CCCE9FE
MALATAASLTLATYLNGKYHITKDLATLGITSWAFRKHDRAAAAGRLNAWLVFAETASKNPDMLAIWSREGTYTYRETLELSNKYGHYFLSRGVRKGEIVALYLQNRPEFIFAWLGLWSIGCAPATVNYALTGDALMHCLRIAGAKLVLLDPDEECVARMEGVRGVVEGGLSMEIAILDETFRDGLFRGFPATVPEDGKLALNTPGEFPSILLYTSGTTGMPKGCAFTMARLYPGLTLRRTGMGDTDGPNGDRWYSCMPLYHGTSAMTLIICLVTGLSIAIGRKFSVRQFWADIRDSDSTAFVYVGEAARYLLAAPPSELDRAHRVRLMYGNGLRPDVWTRFRERFGVAEVGEFFNSTEGVFMLFNYNKGPFTAGAVGHHGAILRRIMNNTYVPVVIDPDTGDVLRDKETGFVVRARYEVGGEMLVNIPNKEVFQGYWDNEAATEKKYLRDAFRKGDLYYRSGDALRRDSDGRWYFMDRLGDTFRWKSENVYVLDPFFLSYLIRVSTQKVNNNEGNSATAEVAEILGSHPSVIEANVYGVKVPNHEGRAGCAALQLSPSSSTLDTAGLARFARARLPKYAVPVFLRIVTNSTHTDNHKQGKVGLREEGVDLKLTGTKVKGGEGDRFLWLEPGSGEYKEFREAEWKGIVEGRVRL